MSTQKEGSTVLWVQVQPPGVKGGGGCWDHEGPVPTDLRESKCHPADFPLCTYSHPPPFLESLFLHSLERWSSGLQNFWQLFHTLLAQVLVSEPLQVDVKSEQDAR